MDSRKHIEDYRHIIISKWSTSNIEGFKKPTPLDLEKQSNYYMKLVDNFFPDNRNIDILEIGCGWGGFIYTLKKLGFHNIDAIDIIPECCEFVSREFRINVACIDVFDFFKKNNKKYDAILAFDVVEHFNKNEIVMLMSQIFESLKEKGLFMMRVPNAGSPRGLYIRYSGFTHEIAFTPLSIEELFKAVGFQRVYCIPEPELSNNPVKRLLKRVLARVTARLLFLDPSFIYSTNVIGVGIK